MHSMQEALEVLIELRTNADEFIVDLHESIAHKERELEAKKKALRSHMDRSASLSQTISFVKGGLSNEGKASAEISDEDAEKLEKDFGSKDPIRDLAMALVKTREYVYPTTLPAREGWDWYDAMKKHAPDILEQVLADEKRAQERRDSRVDETPEYSHAPGELVPEDHDDYEDNIADAMPDTSVSNLTDQMPAVNWESEEKN